MLQSAFLSIEKCSLCLDKCPSRKCHYCDNGLCYYYGLCYHYGPAMSMVLLRLFPDHVIYVVMKFLVLFRILCIALNLDQINRIYR